MGDPAERQHVVRVGRRRAQLTPAPGTHAEPDTRDREQRSAPSDSGPNDARMRQDVPPHY